MVQIPASKFLLSHKHRGYWKIHRLPDGTTAVLCEGSELSSEQRMCTHGDKWQHQQRLWSGGCPGEGGGRGEVRKRALRLRDWYLAGRTDSQLLLVVEEGTSRRRGKKGKETESEAGIFDFTKFEACVHLPNSWWYSMMEIMPKVWQVNL